MTVGISFPSFIWGEIRIIPKFLVILNLKSIHGEEGKGGSVSILVDLFNIML